ncbi:MAG: sensor histidine kinase [Flavipsychrobacter sp.]
MRYSEQQLKELLKVREEFIGIASHELKTPVTSMKAYAEIVKERLDQMGDVKDSELLIRLNTQIDRLTALINDLLDTTKISEGQLQLSVQPVELSQLLQETLEEVKRTTAHHFQINIEHLQPVMADHERIRQVISNLLSNAIKYSPKDTTITVAAANMENGVQVTIRDEGFGIPDEDQGKIFDRFYRVSSGNQDTYPGMGLGLYISAQIIQRHGGTIDVQSKLGKGSAFTFTLPYPNTTL